MNGITDQSGGSGFGAVTAYSCNLGFMLLGDSTRECGSDEMWTNSEPTCAGIMNKWKHSVTKIIPPTQVSQSVYIVMTRSLSKWCIL